MSDSSIPIPPERIRNIWAPWRMKYIESLHQEGGGCFLCEYRDDHDHDRENLVLWRGPQCLAVLNRFPYTGGHALVAPLEHIADLETMSPGAMQEMMTMLRDLQRVLAGALGAAGFNVGINIGRCAGAGLPGHLHAHIVPRWPGDTNFMSVFDDVRMMPASLDSLYTEITRVAGELNLPDLSAR